MRINLLNRKVPATTIVALIFVLIFIDNIILNSKAENTTPPGYFYSGDTVYVEKIIRDTVEIIKYVDTTPIVFHKKAFLYIKDTFNIDERTYYITENDDTVKVFYFDYTYYIFNYTFQDSIVKVDSVLGCDLYTHCLCDDRERIVVFHTCEGESRMIINMLNEQKDK